MTCQSCEREATIIINNGDDTLYVCSRCYTDGETIDIDERRD